MYVHHQSVSVFGVLVQLVQQRKTASSTKRGEKVNFASKMTVLSGFCCTSIIQYVYLRFCITKRSHVSNVHSKFEDFLPSS